MQRQIFSSTYEKFEGGTTPNELLLGLTLADFMLSHKYTVKGVTVAAKVKFCIKPRKEHSHLRYVPCVQSLLSHVVNLG